MAKCRQSIGSAVPGMGAAALILIIVGAALAAIGQFSFSEFDLHFLYSAQLGHIFLFTLWQAVLSTLLSIIIAIPLAKMMHMLPFPGKHGLVRIYTLTFALPAIVLVISLPHIYGRTGVIATLCHWLGIEYTFNLYGLAGILIAHVFYNLPFSFRLFYHSLNSISTQERQLSAQLGLSFWQNFRYLEWPVILRQVLPTAGLIFLLCFTSFVIILTLGGGPKYTSFEVAVYQALRDFELNKLLILCFIQLGFCVLLLGLLRHLSRTIIPLTEYRQKQFFLKPSRWQSLCGYTLIIISALYILSPLVAIVVSGVCSMSWPIILNLNLFMALITSLFIAIGSGTIAFLLAVALLWTASRWQFYGFRYGSHSLLLIGSVVLAIPSMVLAVGFFLLIYGRYDSMGMIAGLIMLSNGLLALPFVVKIMETATIDLYVRYELLACSLNIMGFNRFVLINTKALKSTYLFSFGIGCIMSLGDFSIIAIFGSQHFATLPFYLYQQLDAYHSNAANFSALLLLILCLGLFYFIERLTKFHDRT